MRKKKDGFTIDATGLDGIVPFIEEEFRKAEQQAVIEMAVEVAEKEGFGDEWSVEVRYRREGEEVVFYDVIVRKTAGAEPVIEKWEVSPKQDD